MARNFRFCILFLGLFNLVFCEVFGQTKESVSVQVPSKAITMNEPFVISIVFSSPNASSDLVPSYRFPEIPNFKKQGISRSKSTNMVNGQFIQSLTFSQYYEVPAIGNLAIPTLEVEAGQQTLQIEAFTLAVSPSTLESEENEEAQSIPAELNGKANQPFFIVSTDLTRPFLGQGFTLKMSFFVPESNALALEFDQNDVQIPQLIQQIKPRNCWEENFGLSSERILKVSIKGKSYTEYRFFQASYFPLDSRAIQIPALRFRVLQLQSKSLEKKALFFFSSPFIIQPKILPQHHLSGRVPVGNFQLVEKITTENPFTGQKIEYSPSLVGDGNSILWDSKRVDSDYFLDFSTLSTSTSIAPFREKMFGNKTEIIQVIPKQPGKFVLGKYFQWIYFNVKTEKFDTLRSKLTLLVAGKSSDNKLNTLQREGDLYRGIELKDTLDVVWGRWVNWRQVVNLILMGMGAIIVYLVWKRPK
jgi:hypothetical protein